MTNWNTESDEMIFGVLRMQCQGVVSVIICFSFPLILSLCSFINIYTWFIVSTFTSVTHIHQPFWKCTNSASYMWWSCYRVRHWQGIVQYYYWLELNDNDHCIHDWASSRAPLQGLLPAACVHDATVSLMHTRSSSMTLD